MFILLMDHINSLDSYSILISYLCVKIPPSLIHVILNHSLIPYLSYLIKTIRKWATSDIKPFARSKFGRLSRKTNANFHPWLCLVPCEHSLFLRLPKHSHEGFILSLQNTDLIMSLELASLVLPRIT